MEKYNLKNEQQCAIHDVSVWFLVEIIKPMSTTFKQGMNAWCKYTSNRNDFKLKNIG